MSVPMKRALEQAAWLPGGWAVDGSLSSSADVSGSLTHPRAAVAGTGTDLEGYRAKGFNEERISKPVVSFFATTLGAAGSPRSLCSSLYWGSR